MNKLTNRTETKIRFNEVDSMRIVWHGNYVKYLEDGREAFGRQYKLGYYNVYEYGLMTPIVKLDIDYKRQVKYDDTIIIETEYVPTDAAKIVFDYRLYRASDNQLVLKARSIQVFIDEKGELQITNPDFYTEWKQRWGVI